MSITIPAPKRHYTYTACYCRTGQTFTDRTPFVMSKGEFLESLNRWNRQIPGIWHYWSDDV